MVKYFGFQDIFMKLGISAKGKYLKGYSIFGVPKISLLSAFFFLLFLLNNLLKGVKKNATETQILILN